LSSAHLTVFGHRIVYQAMAALYRMDEAIDPSTIMHFLRRTRRLKRIGGPSFLCALIEHGHPLTPIGCYAARLREA
jgi:replicative DNA helicase